MIKLQIWDTAGQERFRTITTSYYRGAHIIFICYDVTDRETFENLNMWKKEVNRYANSNIKVVVCGTKIDLSSKRKVSFEEGKNFAIEHGFDFFEVSAKENIGIDELFEKSSKNMLDNFLIELKKNNDVQNKNNTSLEETKVINLENKNFSIGLYKKCC